VLRTPAMTLSASGRRRRATASCNCSAVQSTRTRPRHAWRKSRRDAMADTRSRPPSWELAVDLPARMSSDRRIRQHQAQRHERWCRNRRWPSGRPAEFLESKRCRPRRICTELRRFWNADWPQTRMDAHSEHSPVTPVFLRSPEGRAGGGPQQQVVGTALIVCLGLQQPRQCCRLLGKLLRIGLLKLPQVVKLPANARQLLRVRDLQQRPIGLVRDQRE